MATSNPFGSNTRSSRPAEFFESFEPRRLMSGGSAHVAPLLSGANVAASVAPLRHSHGHKAPVKASGPSAPARVKAAEDSGSTTRSGDKSPEFDFKDGFYLANGIDPTKIAGRPDGTGANSVVDTATDPTRRNVRVKAVTGGHDENGNPILFSIFGTIQQTSFTPDAAGRNARVIADKYVAYIFPKAGSNPLSPASKRQDELLPLNNGYFSNDPLQIWREVFVNYVPAALTTPAGKAMAADLTARNGKDADGTPYLKTQNDILKAQQAGLVTVTRRADDGSQGAPWFFCAVYKDPRGGAITSDATLTVVRNLDGTPSASSRDIQALFDSVRVK